MCAVVRLRALMARQAARLITNPPIKIESVLCESGHSDPATCTKLFYLNPFFMLNILNCIQLT
jgi:hypothetical protein